MLNSSPPKKAARPISTIGHPADNSNDLKFISELGRSLLFTVHPKKGRRTRRRGHTKRGPYRGVHVCRRARQHRPDQLRVCNANGEITENSSTEPDLKSGLHFLPPQIGYSEIRQGRIPDRRCDHKFEYVSPLHINGEIKGAIVTGFVPRTN